MASPLRRAAQPADPSPDRQKDPVGWDRVDGDKQSTITGYWAAPSIRGLGKLTPRRRNDFPVAKSGRTDSETDSESEFARLARLAEEARRCTAELGAILGRLTNYPALANAIPAEEELEVARVNEDVANAAEKPAKRSAATILPKKIVNRVFKPLGIVATDPVKPVKAHFKKDRPSAGQSRPQALATAAISMPDLVPSRKELNIFGFMPPSAARSELRP